MKNKEKFVISGFSFVLFVISAIGYFINRNGGTTFFFYMTGMAFIYSFLKFILPFFRQREKPNRRIYDKYWRMKRGECFTMAFYVLVGCLLLDALIRLVFNCEWSDYYVGVVSCVIISWGVYIIMANYTGVYMYQIGSFYSIPFIHFFVGIFNIAVCLYSIHLQIFIIDGKITLTFISLVLGIVLVIESIVFWINSRLNPKGW